MSRNNHKTIIIAVIQFNDKKNYKLMLPILNKEMFAQRQDVEMFQVNS